MRYRLNIEFEPCPVCMELTQNNGELKVTEIYERGYPSGYFNPENEMIINYCPTCGKRLSKKNKDEVRV